MVFYTTLQPRALALRVSALIALCAPLVALSSPLGDILQRLQGDTWVDRSFSLSDLGFDDAVLLNGYDARQEFYLPLPRSLQLTEASIDFTGRYYKAEEGRTSMMLLVNSRPAFSRRIESAEGDASQTLKIDTALARSTGFLRLGVNWLNNVARNMCETDRATGNVLSIAPDTRFKYRFSSDALTTLADAWITLPARPTLLVASRHVGKASYDSAWRIGAALEQFNRRVNVKAFPVPGDLVDTSGWRVPAALATMPTFAGMASGSERYVIKDEAEVGALLVLGAADAGGDILVMDAALQKQINTALDALAVQFAGDGDASRAFAGWRARQSAVEALPTSHQIRLGILGARPVIVLAEDAGAQAAGAFSEAWRGMLTSRKLTVNKANSPDAGDRSVIRLGQLGAGNAGFDVVARGEWTATLPLDAISAGGQMPSDVVIDVAAAPGASATRPVASIFWNNVLLAAKRLDADGRAERLDAHVPSYALGLQNVVRVSFQRQPYTDNCNETPQGFPVNVLPSSYVRTAKAETDGSFLGLLSLMAGSAQVVVPSSYLDDAPRALANTIRMAVAAGVSPVRAELVVSEPGKEFSPTKPFLALQALIAGVESKVRVKDENLQINGQKSTLLDVDGLSQLSAVEVTRANGQDGLLWQQLGAQSATPRKAFVLNRGDIALLGAEGPVSWVDSKNPELTQTPGASSSPFYAWSHFLPWGLPALIIGSLAFLVLLIVARRFKQRRAAKSS